MVCVSKQRNLSDRLVIISSTHTSNKRSGVRMRVCNIHGSFYGLTALVDVSIPSSDSHAFRNSPSKSNVFGSITQLDNTQQ